MSRARVVLDTNVLVSALLTPSGNPAVIYKKFLAGLLDLVVSTDILMEYEDVLHRPRPRIPASDAGIVLAAIRQHGERVSPDTSTIAMVDEDDRIFYDTAISARAYLVTGNIKHYPREAFILTPAEFLQLR